MIRYSSARVLALIFVTLVTSGCPDKQSNVSQDLIDAFANGCNSNGVWTQSALNHTNALITALESAKLNRDACKPFQATLANVQALQGQLRFLTENTSYKNYRQAEESLTELDLAIRAIPTDASGLAANTELQPLLDAYKQALVETKVNFALAKGQSNVETFNHSTAQLASVMQSLTMQAGDLSMCLNQSPGAAVQLATNALAVGGSFITPVLGLGVASVGQLFNGAIEYIRHKGTNDTIWKLYSAKMPMALTCGLEAMTQHYCQASDAMALVQFQQKGYPKRSGPPNDLWRGMDILGRRLPVLNKWILKVKNGVPANDLEEGLKRNKAWAQIHKLDQVDTEFGADLASTRSLYESTNDEDTQKKTLSGFLVRMATKLSNKCAMSTGDGAILDCGSGVFSAYKGDAYVWACWIVHGMTVTADKCPKIDLSESLEQYVEGRLLKDASLSTFETNWSAALEAVTNFANVEFYQKVTLSPQSALDMAYYPKSNNPRQALEMIKVFLESALTQNFGVNPHRKPQIETTLATVTKVIKILEDTRAGYEPKERLLDLFKTLELNKSARRFSEDLSNIIATEIDARLENGQMPQDVTEILRVSGNDIRDRLRASGVTRLGDVVEDLNEARGLTEQNIKAFREHFKRSLTWAVRDLYNLALKNGEIGPKARKGANRPQAQRLAKLCTLLVATDKDFPSQEAWKLCSKAVFYSSYADPTNPNDPLALSVLKLRVKLKDKKDFGARACAYYNFKRSERLAELLIEKKKDDETENSISALFTRPD